MEPLNNRQGTKDVSALTGALFNIGIQLAAHEGDVVNNVPPFAKLRFRCKANEVSYQLVVLLKRWGKTAFPSIAIHECLMPTKINREFREHLQITRRRKFFRRVLFTSETQSRAANVLSEDTDFSKLVGSFCQERIAAGSITYAKIARSLEISIQNGELQTVFQGVPYLAWHKCYWRIGVKEAIEERRKRWIGCCQAPFSDSKG